MDCTHKGWTSFDAWGQATADSSGVKAVQILRQALDKKAPPHATQVLCRVEAYL